MPPLSLTSGRCLWSLPMLAALTLSLSHSPALPAQDQNPRTAYFTTGDTQDLLDMPPLDSRATITAAFESLQQQYAVERIWWRGGQDEIWGEQFVIRPENRGFARVWDWWRDLQYRRVGTNRIAVEEARRLGLQIWLTYGLFDNGSQADAGYSGFPYAVEDRLRVEHPEWAPVNRWGTWRQGGPIEFSYPQARLAMAEYLTRYVLEGGYDGISFLTYAENFSQRYDDEFGYNEPIVAEYQAKFGRDIRHEEFDRAAWRRLRGNHVTTFLRLLKTRLAPHGKKIAVCVHGELPDRPCKWNIDGGVWTAGNFSWSIYDWLRGDVVDEICLFSPASDKVRKDLTARASAEGRGVTISAFRTRGDLEPGIPRVMFLGREIEAGYKNEAWVDWPDEKLADEPAASLEGPDVFARRRVVTRALKGLAPLNTEQLARALRDEDVYVRRTALRTIGRHQIEAAGAGVVRALDDPENSVRCQAALALGELRETPGLVPLLRAAFAPESTFQFHSRGVVEALKKMNAQGRLTPADKLQLADRLNAPEPRIRELVLYYFTLIGAPATPGVQTSLTRIVLGSDDEAYARELAIVNLRSSFGPTAEVRQTLRQVLDQDRDHAVQLRGAMAFGQMHARLDQSDPAREESLEILEKFLRQYGGDCQRTDREWGWRPLGNVLLEYGAPGIQRLHKLMADPTDAAVRDRAWRILYLKQGDQFHPITEEEDAEAHSKKPR